MLQTFIITLREGVEAALVIAIAMAYVKRIGRLDLLPAVYRGLLTAVFASFIAAWGFAKIYLNEDAYEGWVLLVSAAFVLSLVIWMNKHGAHVRDEIETGLQKGVARGGDSGGGAWGVFAFVFLMIFREGVETVLLLAALRLDTSGVLEGVGAIAGIGLAVLFGFSFVRGTIRVNLKQFFRMTTVILMVVVAQLTLTGLHELSESQILPSSSTEMAIIGPIVKNEVFFFITILALAAMMVLLESRGRRAQAEAGGNEGSAAARKARWSARREKLWMVACAATSCVFILLITAEFIYTRTQTALSAARPVAFENGAVRLETQPLTDGYLHRFVVEDQGVKVRFIVIAKPDHSLAVAYDACGICGTQGFFQKGNEVICRNCASDLVISSIGSPGGCNPIPLPAHMDGGVLVIESAAFDRGVKLFRNG